MEVPAEGRDHEDGRVRVRLPQGQRRGRVVAMETNQTDDVTDNNTVADRRVVPIC